MTITQQALAALQPPPGAPASAWATRITACWQVSVKAILEVGRLLAEAKEALPHGAFGQMCKTDLPFTARTAQMLMAISADPRITNPKHVSLLPASWGTLYEITKLTDEQFDRGIAEKTIRPDMERKEVPRGARSIMGSRQEPDGSLDYSPTPPWGTRALIEIVLRELGITDFDSVMEPACGEGHMAEVLREYFSDVIATDVHDYGYSDLPPINFLTGEPNGGALLDAAWIITNPPFKDAEKFALAALARARTGVAMFVRWQWIESVGRYENLFSQYPPAIVAVFAERIPLHMGRWEPTGSTATAYCWIVWHQVPQQTQTRLFWIPPGQRKALTRADDITRFTTSPVTKAKRDSTGASIPHDPSTGEVTGAAA